MEINSDEDILKYFFDHCNLIENNILHIDTLNIHVDRMFLVTSSLKCARKIIYILLRVGFDKYLGKTTCKNASVVDYLLVSSNMFDNIASFHIEDFNTLFSDVHCELRISSHEFF